MIKRAEIETVVQEAIGKKSQANVPTMQHKVRRPMSTDQLDKFPRTAGMGGFDEESRFLKKVNAKGAGRPTSLGKTLWASASRSPADRSNAKTLNMSKQVLVEAGLEKEEDVEYETKRGIVWIGRERIANWHAAREKVVWNPAALKKVDVNVDGQILNNAAQEKMNSK